MTTNNATPVIVSAPSIHRAELAAWTDAITDLAATGNNAEARKAALTLMLADDPSYQGLIAQSRAARQRLAEAERRVIVLKERCRLLRSAVALMIEIDSN